MQEQAEQEWRLVFCRIGSLEKGLRVARGGHGVFCRIGSLENVLGGMPSRARVFCRIGSLESAGG